MFIQHNESIYNLLLVTITSSICSWRPQTCMLNKSAMIILIIKLLIFIENYTVSYRHTLVHLKYKKTVREGNKWCLWSPSCRKLYWKKNPMVIAAVPNHDKVYLFCLHLAIVTLNRYANIRKQKKYIFHGADTLMK